MSKEEKDEPDMTNKLGVLRHKNFRQVMKKDGLSTPAVAIRIGVSTSTLAHNCAKKYKSPFSDRTLKKIYDKFAMKPGALDKVDFRYTGTEVVVAELVPTTAPKKVPMKIGKMEFTVSPDDATRVLKFLALDE